MSESNESVDQPTLESAEADAMARLTALLESELEPPTADDDGDPADEAETVDAEDEEQPDDLLSEEEVEDPTVETEEDTEAEAEAEIDETYEVDGENLTISELKLGWLRQKDYTVKTQNLSAQRKAFEAQSEQTEATMNALMNAAGMDLARFENVNWEKYAVENPEQYAQAKAAFEQTQSTHAFIKAQADEWTKQQQQRTDQAQREAAKESLTVLKTNIPNWNNELYYKIASYAQKDLGVTTEEFNKVADHRLITALYKAMQFDQAKSVAVKKKVKTSASKNLTGSKADSTAVVSDDSERKAMSQLKNSGRIEDAAAVLLSRMK